MKKNEKIILKKVSSDPSFYNCYLNKNFIGDIVFKNNRHYFQFCYNDINDWDYISLKLISEILKNLDNEKEQKP